MQEAGKRRVALGLWVAQVFLVT